MVMNKNILNSMKLSYLYSTNINSFFQSVQQDEELKAFQKTHSQKNGHLEQKLVQFICCGY